MLKDMDLDSTGGVTSDDADSERYERRRADDYDDRRRERSRSKYDDYEDYDDYDDYEDYDDYSDEDYDENADYAEEGSNSGKGRVLKNLGRRREEEARRLEEEARKQEAEARRQEAEARRLEAEARRSEARRLRGQSQTSGDGRRSRDDGYRRSGEDGYRRSGDDGYRRSRDDGYRRDRDDDYRRSRDEDYTRGRNEDYRRSRDAAYRDERYPDSRRRASYEPDDAEDDEGGKGFSIALIIGILVFAAIFLFALYQLLSIYLEYRAGKEEYDAVRAQAEALRDKAASEADAAGNEGVTVTETDADGNPVAVEVRVLPNQKRNREWFASLELIYPGIVGWITIPETVVDYPVMYSGDNEYYLTHTSTGTANGAGSIFLEENNNPNLDDIHTIIYGHNMNNGSMFADLKKYEDISFFQAHPTITLDVEDGTLTYQIFSVQVTDSYSDCYQVGFARGAAFDSFVQTLKANSIYDTGVSVSGEDYVLTLSTCTNVGNGRVVVHAKRVDTPAE